MNEPIIIEQAKQESKPYHSQGNCHNCGATNLRIFYKVRDIPVHSCLMSATKREAINIPVGDLVLGFCEQCGFITNTVYDAFLQNYSPGYEDQQSYSGTFNAFARTLASQLVNKYNLKHKNILEIGCSNGDFLVLMCQLGNNRGVGIDPTCVEERLPEDMAKQIRFIRDFYSERYAHVTGDMVICRHTLEHIQYTQEFVRMIRRSIGNKLDTVVFFEVPDTRRVLRELAFWDIYYEHCSYFTGDSLARLFRSSGFEIINLSLDFNDQYLLIEAKPAIRPSQKGSPLETGLQQTAQDVDYFFNQIARKLAKWRAYINLLCMQGKRTVIWGSGSKCVAFLTTLGVGSEIGAIVDINPHRHGKFMPGPGLQVQSPEFLKEYQPDEVIVMNPVYQNEIKQMLHEMNLNPKVITV